MRTVAKMTHAAAAHYILATESRNNFSGATIEHPIAYVNGRREAPAL